MSLKICFISNYAYRLFNQKSRITFGGIETIFYIIAHDLVKDKRFNVSFLLEDDIHLQPAAELNNQITLYKTSRLVQPKIYPDKQIEKYHRWFNYWADKISWLGKLPHLDFFRLWENLKQVGADVYIFASPGYESGLITFLAKMMKKKSVYIVVNDELFQDKNQLYIYGLKHADVVLCYSFRHQRVLKEKHQVKAIYLPPWFPRPKSILAFKQRKYLLWVGRIESRKQPKIFLRLAKSLPQFNFVMVVASNPHEPGLFKAIIRLAAGIPNLKLKQGITFSKLGSYYQRAIAFIDTSDYQNLNMTQIQAAYYKTPCLSMFYDPNNTFYDYNWGISALGNFPKLIQNAQLMVTDLRLWQKLSCHAYQFADTVYNKEINLNSFKKIIFRLTP